MNKIIPIIILVVVLGGGIFFLTSRQGRNTTGGDTEATPSVAPTQADETSSAQSAKTFTLEDVAMHATAEDCWLAIEGKVYDVTSFIASAKHPGGKAILQGCGKDATELFNTRPMGSGTPHSDKARSFLPNYYIGDLK